MSSPGNPSCPFARFPGDLRGFLSVGGEGFEVAAGAGVLSRLLGLEKTVLPPGDAGIPLAPAGDLSPSSRTASWASHWPIKPDVVFEGSITYVGDILNEERRTVYARVEVANTAGRLSIP